MSLSRSTTATAASASALGEAREHLLRAERNSRPTVTRWKPKLSAAGDEFCKAAILFYQLGEVEAAKANLLRACECFKKKRAWYSAAKTLEQAMAITHKQGDMSTMTELAWRSAALFRKAGQPDSAAQLLERASQALRGERQRDNSVLMLEKAVETVETENRPIQAACYVSKLLQMALERNDLAEAIVKARKLVELYQEANHKPSTGRSVVALVLLLLRVHRTAEAEIVAREFGNNCTAEQNLLIEDLLDAYDQNDEAKIGSALKNKSLAALDAEFKTVLAGLALHPDVAKLGTRDRTRTRRKISMDQGGSGPADEDAAKTTTNTSGSNSSNSSSSSDDDSKSERRKKRGSNKKGKKNSRTEAASGDDNVVGNKDDSDIDNKPAKEEKKKEEKKKDASPAKSKIPQQVAPAALATPAAAITSVAKVKDVTEGGESEEDTTALLTKKDQMKKVVRKMKTVDSASTALKDKTQQQKLRKTSSNLPGPSSAVSVDFTTDSIDRHRPGNLPGPAVYVDVEGVDPLQPSYLGMTTDQFREFKRAHAFEEEDAAFGDDY